MNKIKIAFIKFGGLSAGGTERWLQMMAANLPKEIYDIDYFYCDSAPYLGSNYKHADTDPNRLQYMKDNGINLIKFNVGFKDITTPTHNWINTDFWQLFDSSKYDFVQTARAGNKEYPFYLIDLPVVEYITLAGGIDFSSNIIHSIHLSNWQRSIWLKKGGRAEKSSVIPIPVEKPLINSDLRQELKIPLDAVVAGFHQRPDNNIASDIPLRAFKKIYRANWHFIVMGGGNFYREQAKELKLENIHFIEANSNPKIISSFLNTLDIFSHGRKDGETFGTVLAEAMIHGLPCLSHYTEYANAQKETMNNGGFFANNYEEYSQLLKNFYENKKLRDEVGNLGKNFAETNYSIEGTVKKLCEVYDRVLVEKNNISKDIFDSIIFQKNKEIKITLWKKILFAFKKIIFNKFFLHCYKILKKIYKKFKKIIYGDIKNNLFDAS